MRFPVIMISAAVAAMAAGPAVAQKVYAIGTN